MHSKRGNETFVFLASTRYCCSGPSAFFSAITRLASAFWEDCRKFSKSALSALPPMSWDGSSPLLLSGDQGPPRQRRLELPPLDAHVQPIGSIHPETCRLTSLLGPETEGPVNCVLYDGFVVNGIEYRAGNFASLVDGRCDLRLSALRVARSGGFFVALWLGT